MTDQTTGPPAQESTQPATLPNEDPRRTFLNGLLESIKLFIVDPMRAYRQMPVTSEIGRPLAYGVILGWLGGLIDFMWGMVGWSIFGFLSQMPGTENLALPMAASLTGGVIGLILAPIFTLIVIFVLAAILHLFLMMVGGANPGFVATLRVVCYAQTAQLAYVVPGLGWLICLVWSLFLCTIGLAVAHRTTTGKAATAVLLPFGLCCVCVITVGVMFLIGALSAGALAAGH